MEYVLFAFSDSQTSSKTRLGKLRHLDSLFFFLLIVALLFFQVFQHNQLRAELLSRRPDYMLQEILQERIPQLERQLEQLQSLLSEESTQIHQRLQQNKQLTIKLGRELGLPFRTDQEQKNDLQVNKAVQANMEVSRSYEVIEIEPSSQEEQDSEDQSEPGEDGSQLESVPEEEVITLQERKPFCSYLQYLVEGKDTDHPSLWSRPSKQQYRINISSYVRKGPKAGHWIEGLKPVAEELCKAVLVALLVIAVLLLTFQKKRRGKHAKSFLRDIWRRVFPEERRRGSKEGKEQKGQEWRGSEWPQQWKTQKQVLSL